MCFIGTFKSEIDTCCHKYHELDRDWFEFETRLNDQIAWSCESLSILYFERVIEKSVRILVKFYISKSTELSSELQRIHKQKDKGIWIIRYI